MHDKAGMYFISFAVVDWMDVFVRHEYFQFLANCMSFHVKNKSMIIYAYCIMTSHVHLVFRDEAENPSKLLREFKSYSSKELRKMIESNPKESRDWMLDKMREAAETKSSVKHYQFWQNHNKPIELFSNAVIDQKIDYIHNNPVESGFVNEPHHWKFSSASDYAGIKSPVEVTLVG